MTPPKAKAAASRNDWRTPPELVVKCSKIAWTPEPDLDVAASRENAVCARYYDETMNGIAQAWTGNVWCNPPYNAARGQPSVIAPWVRKAWAEWEVRTALNSILMLLPANRTEQPWWQDYVEKQRQARSDFKVFFLRGRAEFEHPETFKLTKGSSFGLVLLTWKRPAAFDAGVL